VRVEGLDDLRRIRLHRVEIEFADGTEIPDARIRDADGVQDVRVEGRVLTCTVQGSFEPLMRALQGAAVANLTSQEPGLEEIFLDYFRRSDELALRP
jgi:ABC-2 type transport system ATP-binding protein